MRQETSSPQFVEIVSKLKRLADAQSFKQLRLYVRSHISDKRAKEVGKAIDEYMRAGNSAKVNSFMRSYTHSAAGTIINADIKSLIEQIAVSRNKLQVNDLLASLETKMQEMKGLYSERNKILDLIVDASDDRYQLLLDTRNDFHSWYVSMIKDLRASLTKYNRRTGDAIIPEKIRARLIGWSDDFEAFYRSIGIRSDRLID